MEGIHRTEEGVIMTINFGPIGLAVVAKVQNAPNSQFFFAKNGEPRNIFCHCNQGGDIDVTSGGNVLLKKERAIYPPDQGTQIILLRESTDPQNKNYTKARAWALLADWEKVSWKLRKAEIFRAIGYNHCCAGRRQTNHREEIELISSMSFSDIVMEYPRGKNDPYGGERYTTKFHGNTLSCRIRWETLRGGSWIECADPRPTVS